MIKSYICWSLLLFEIEAMDLNFWSDVGNQQDLA